MRDYVSEKTAAHAFHKRAVCFFLTFAAVLFTFLLCRIPAEAREPVEAAEDAEVVETVEAGEQSKAFAIVFDNSGSMYTSTVWCDTIYSMEVFAAMADEGDEIGIYPMNPIEVGGETYTRESPLILQGGDDAYVIRDIYTPSSLDTHIETITDAYNGLLSMEGEDKWLIVLSDGDLYYEDGVALDSEYGTEWPVTQERLDSMLSDYNDYVNVVYLVIGEAATVPVVDGSMYSEVIIASGPEDITGDVIGISNVIYDREGMDAVSDTLEFDQPLSSLVLFVRGEDIENLRLVDADGNEAGTLLSTSSLLYAEAPGSGSVALSPVYYADNAADTGLGGEIVTYGEIPEGTYMIQYDGTAAGVEVYCEPESDIVPAPEGELTARGPVEDGAESEELTDIEESEEIEDELALAGEEEEIASAERGRRAHPVRFWILIIVLIIVIAAVVAFVIIMIQKALPNAIRAKVSRFTLNGIDEGDIKKPYIRYSGGGKRTGRIVIGPHSGTTDFDYRLTLNLEACGNRFGKSCDRGAVIVSPPTEIGYLTSYTIESGGVEYTFMNGKTAQTKDRIPLGQKFTYTMQGMANDGISGGNQESIVMVVELEFR